jgi:two-component system, cell cycle sensor histidine kinase and response regulator CckA
MVDQFSNGDFEALQRKVAELEAQNSRLRLENERLRGLGDHMLAGSRSYDENKHTYRVLFEEAMTPIFMADLNGIYIEANRAALRFLECTRSDLIGRSVLDFAPPEALDRQEREHFPFFRSRMVETEYLIHGVVKSLLLSVVPLELNGRPVMCGIGQDITERKQAEAAVQTANELFSLFIRQSPIYAFIKEVTPTESRTLQASENYLQMIGIAGSAMVGKTMEELFPAEFAAKISADDWQVVSRGENLCLDEELNGRQYTTFKFPLRLGGKNLLAGYTIDITERKVAEEALRQRENQLQKILEILPIGLWFADKKGTLLGGNPKGVAIWGAEPQVAISEFGRFKAWRLPGREPLAAEDWALVRTIRDGATITDELLEIETFDGRRKTILNYTAPVLDDLGNVDGAIVVNLDITERMLLEDQLRQAQKMESIGRLAGGVAHDFNNMLSVILGNTELAMGALDPSASIYEELQEILNAALRSKEVTRQLLAYARKQTIVPQVLDLNQTIESMLSMLRRLLRENIALTWLPKASLWPVRMDPSQIDQILTNLCVNARDAIADVGTIAIETGMASFDLDFCAAHAGAVPGDFVLLAISDNGCGMDEHSQSQVFEPFFTTKETGEGTGLGLATVYGIVKQNEGFIYVYSELGHGTTFRIYFPRHLAQADDTPLPEPIAAAATGSEVVLLVEDEVMILKMSEKMLTGLGYYVLSAASPGEGLRLAREHAGDIHLLMTDVIMPEMNGRDLADHLLALYPGLKCLFMSGYPANVIADHGILDEGVSFIQKPFSFGELAAHVRAALDS